MREFLSAFDALPDGAFRAEWQGSPYVAVKSSHAAGKSEKLVAHEAGGTGYISLNIYRLSDGRVLLKPCEMPEDRVRRFVLEAKVGEP
ncbi:hypothetical protein [Palleronia abyssalis]|uniref:Uncharacterized protein n=1 Tax=Palleronia abyssalis TaxID=1501240 RepID=A0A2R8BS34_9RHOB|nr:hypothetical protein [Palleronia abyssalis]SPJ22948.1 hypothetical protein PAA8504_00749 [Palleronia abyssalis]